MIRYLRVQWDRVGGAVCMTCGAVAIAIGWIGVSRALVPAAQIPYVVSGGIGGLYLLGLGATLWLSADLRDEWRHLDELEDRVTDRVVAQLATATVSVEPTQSPVRRQLVAVDRDHA